MRRLSNFFVTIVATAILVPNLGGISVQAAGGVVIDSNNFPDSNFRGVVQQFDKDKNGNLSDSEIKAVTNIDCYNKNISNLSGIKYFSSLKNLDCSNNKLQSLDVNSISTLETICCRNNKISKLDVSNLTRLKQLFCENNGMQNLILSKSNTSLFTLWCYDNKLSELDISFSSYLVRAYNGTASAYKGNSSHSYYKEATGKNYTICCDAGLRFKTILTKTMVYRGKGTVSDSVGSYAGDKITISANPDNGYKFSKWIIWEEDTSFESYEQNLTLTADRRRECRACFDAVTPTAAPTAAPKRFDECIPSDSKARSSNSVEQFVSRLYKFSFGREPDTDGLNYWTNKLKSYEMTGGEAAKGFIDSPEFRSMNYSNEQFVEVLYTIFFDRASDADGKAFWLGKLNSGELSRLEAASSFINSQEWANTCAYYGIISGTYIVSTVNIYPNDATITLVAGIYEKALKRSYDEEGLAYWSYMLASHKLTWENVGVEFFMSEEMRSKNLSNEEYVTRLYQTFMEREPETDGYNYWVSQLNSGVSRQTVVNSFTRSEEFLAKCASAQIIPFR